MAGQDQQHSVGTNRPLLVAGIGASAGGVEALTAFFDAVSPNTGCAFVVIQHLSPEHKSVMDELLGRRTSMEVTVATDNMALKRDTVHLMPHRKNMEIVDGRLKLSDPALRDSLNLPIDLFFDSLARDAGSRAVAMIMSGTGSDGSRGIRRIKETGGLVLVQDPESAQFDGMPRSALFTELADFSLTPQALAAFFDDYASHPTVHQPGHPSRIELDDSNETLDEIFRHLKKHTDIDFSHYKPATVARRLERRIGINRLEDIDAYRNLLRESSREVRILGRELLINVTNFFRDDDAFTFLETDVIRELMDKLSADRELRVWVAGCSTGEEAYSIAILIDEAFRRDGKRRRAKIFATDVDTSALNEASPGHYTSAIEKDVSPLRLKRYFDALDDGYVLRQEIRQMVVFAKHNMINDPPFPNIDLVCCRNVLIYFQHTTQQVVISKFHFALRDGGYAFFGSAESIGELDTHFDCIQQDYRVYRKSKNFVAPLTTASALPRHSNRASITPIDGLLKNYRSGTRDQGMDQIRESLLAEYLPACVVLDDSYRAIHVYGNAGRYLTRFPAGKVTNRVADIFPRELSTSITVALDRARKDQTVINYEAIPVSIDGEQELIDIHVRQFENIHNSGNDNFLLVLRPTVSKRPAAGSTDKHDGDVLEDRRVHDLEEQLADEQRRRQTAGEQLESANEELQSANEELIASNEELQSTNEELQSVNEELFTVNSEFQEKIIELSLINDDMDKIMEFTHIGIVFIDAEQRIRQFSQAATRYFRLLGSDIGRPLEYVANEFQNDNLAEEISKSLGGEETETLRLNTYAGSVVDVRLVPNRVDMESGEPSATGVILIASDSPGVLRKQNNKQATPA